MRRTAVSLTLLGFLFALPASASVIVGWEPFTLELRGFTARPIAIDRSASLTLRANDLSDRTLDAFTVLDAGASGDLTLSGRVLNRVSGSVHLGNSGRLVSSGSIFIVGSGLVSTNASFGRRNFVWISGTPAPTAPIPEPSAALLFAVGTGLVVASLRRLRA